MAKPFVPGKSLAPLPELSYLRMLADGAPEGGVDVWNRTPATQAELHKLWKAGRGPKAAAPNANAPHVRRVAFDTHTTGVNGAYEPSRFHRWLTEGGNGKVRSASEKITANKYGWVRNVAGERWHFQYFLARDKVLWRIVQKEIGGLTVDGIPGSKTVTALRTWQKANGLTPDGIPGAKTLAKLRGGTKPVESKPPASQPLLRKGSSGAAVTELQQALNVFGFGLAVDGKFGGGTDRAVRAFQGWQNLAIDGVVGGSTRAALATPIRRLVAIIGAGAGNTKAGDMSAKAKRRADVIARLLRANPSWVAVLTGGTKGGQKTSESAHAKNYLVGKGVDAKQLILEEGSGSTFGNFQYGMPLAQETGAAHVLAVSDFTHARRCISFAHAANENKKLGLKLIGGVWFLDGTKQDTSVAGTVTQTKPLWSGMNASVVENLDSKFGIV